MSQTLLLTGRLQCAEISAFCQWGGERSSPGIEHVRGLGFSVSEWGSLKQYSFPDSQDKTKRHSLVLGDNHFLNIDDVLGALCENPRHVGMLMIVFDCCFAGKWANEFWARDDLKDKLAVYSKKHQKNLHLNMRLSSLGKERSNDAEVGAMYTCELLQKYRKVSRGELDSKGIGLNNTLSKAIGLSRLGAAGRA